MDDVRGTRKEHTAGCEKRRETHQTELKQDWAGSANEDGQRKKRRLVRNNSMRVNIKMDVD